MAQKLGPTWGDAKKQSKSRWIWPKKIKFGPPPMRMNCRAFSEIEDAFPVIAGHFWTNFAASKIRGDFGGDFGELRGVRGIFGKHFGETSGDFGEFGGTCQKMGEILFYLFYCGEIQNIFQELFLTVSATFERLWHLSLS